MFKKKKKDEPSKVVADEPQSTPLSPVEIAQYTTEITTLAAEARVALDRLRAIKNRVEALGGNMHIHAESVRFWNGYGHGDTPSWEVTAEYCAKL